MTLFHDLTNIWNTIKEIDLKPYRAEAQRGIRIAVAGKSGSGRHNLADQMRRDPARPSVVTVSPVLILDLDHMDEAFQRGSQADLIILMMDAGQIDIITEIQLARRWLNTGKKMLVVINQKTDSINVESVTPSVSLDQWGTWGKKHVLAGSVTDLNFITQKFCPLVVELIPDLWIALGRYFPLFRIPTAKQMINDTCLSNAT